MHYIQSGNSETGSGYQGTGYCGTGYWGELSIVLILGSDYDLKVECECRTQFSATFSSLVLLRLMNCEQQSKNLFRVMGVYCYN